MSKERYEPNEIEQSSASNLLASNPLELAEIVAEVVQYVPKEAHGTLAATNRLFYAEAQGRRIAEILLLSTSQGNEDKVVGLFKLSRVHIRNIIVRSDVEDYSGRRFKNISPFQYALWARDWHMWENMLQAFDSAEHNALTDKEWQALPDNDKRNAITQHEIAEIRSTLLAQYHEVVDKDKGLDYTISRMNENNELMTVQVKGETHFDLKGPEFCLMPEEANFVPKKGKIYVKIEQDSLHYTLISLSGEPVTEGILLEHLAPLTQLSTNDDIKPFITPILKITAMRGHTHSQALIRSLKTYCESFNNWNGAQRENHWRHVVGMAQRKVPANIAQEHCRTDLVLRKERSFTELIFPRTLKFNYWINKKTESWFPLHLGNKLGDDFGIYSGPRLGWRDGPWAQCCAGSAVPSLNLAGLIALCEVRSEQVIELGGRLSKQVQQEMDIAPLRNCTIMGLSYTQLPAEKRERCLCQFV